MWELMNHFGETAKKLSDDAKTLILILSGQIS